MSETKEIKTVYAEKRFAQKTHCGTVLQLFVTENVLTGHTWGNVLRGEIKEKAEKLAIGEAIPFTMHTVLERIN